MIFDNQLRYASSIIDAYQGDPPLHVWLKDYFRANKQMGSRDRKLVSRLVYGFYRLGHTLKNIPVGERILTGLFLCTDGPVELLQYFKPAWNEQAARPLEEKIALVKTAGLDFRLTDIFPWKDQLSEDIDHEAFCHSFLRQPDLFLRIRPGFEAAVLQKLDQSPAARSYEFIPPFTLRLPNGYKVEELFTPDKEVVIQDYSSQRIAAYLQQPGPGSPSAFWDACAASGGKSILAFDLFPGIAITASDIRESILHNLRQRFRQAGIVKYQSFVADLVKQPGPGSPVAFSSPGLGPRLPFDLILADAPCSGSGTWSRTPEELYFFHPRKITHYNEIQQKIIANIAPRLKQGAQLVYTTCSVFKMENEKIAALIRDGFGLKEAMTGIIKGYDQHADSMFAARFGAPDK